MVNMTCLPEGTASITLPRAPMFVLWSVIVILHLGSPFPAPPPICCSPPPPFVTAALPAPGLLLNANLTGSSLLPCCPLLLPTAPPPLCVPSPAPSPGPRLTSSSSPKSLQLASRFPCVARWIPNAACWSGTTSSSSSGFRG
jgi:hypothetical protein